MRQQDFFSELGRELQEVWQGVLFGLSMSSAAFRNQLRRIRRLELDYVVIPVGGPLPERSGPPRGFIQRQLPLPPEPLSMQTLNYRLRCTADAANVKGVVFVFRALSAGIATLQNLRRSMERLQQSGKQVVVYTPYLDMAHYFVASVADRIVVPPGASFEVLGLRSETIFLKDALDKIGVEADVIQISPYKTASNTLAKAEMTPEQREQIEWLLDETFDMVTSGMALGRGVKQQEILDLIDTAPFFAEEALARGLVDDIGYEDSLPMLLARKPENGDFSDLGREANDSEARASEAEAESNDGVEEDPDDTAGEEQGDESPAKHEARNRNPEARLATWAKAREILLETTRRPTEQYIGVVSLEGLIAMGPSRQPPVDVPLPFLGGATAGEETVTRQLRRAEQDNRMAGLLLHVDSAGGVALASDLIWREVERVARKKPVLAYMGNTAASGGYYICAPAKHVMAQSMSITGSIGVLSLHLSTSGLYEKVSVNRINISRGERAMLYSDVAPLSDDERQIYWDTIVDSYKQFKQAVADGRNLSYDELDPICEGRVWTGRQALGHKLIDSHGDFVDAIDKVCELAKLPRDDQHRVPVANIYDQGGAHLLPRPSEAAQAIAELFSLEQVRSMTGRPLLLMPFSIKFR